MKEYSICDLHKSMFDDDVVINAKSPLDAARRYIKQLGENKTVTRDLFNRGRLVVRGCNGSYVYDVA